MHKITDENKYIVVILLMFIYSSYIIAFIKRFFHIDFKQTIGEKRVLFILGELIKVDDAGFLMNNKNYILS